MAGRGTGKGKEANETAFLSLAERTWPCRLSQSSCNIISGAGEWRTGKGGQRQHDGIPCEEHGEGEGAAGQQGRAHAPPVAPQDHHHHGHQVVVHLRTHADQVGRAQHK